MKFTSFLYPRVQKQLQQQKKQLTNSNDLRDQNWPCRKTGQGQTQGHDLYKFCSTADPGAYIPSFKGGGNWPSGSGKEDFFN